MPSYFGLMTNTISKIEPYLVPVASEVTLSVNLLAGTTLLTVNPSLLSMSLATGADGVLNAAKIPDVTPRTTATRAVTITVTFSLFTVRLSYLRCGDNPAQTRRVMAGLGRRVSTIGSAGQTDACHAIARATVSWSP
jgi:hypothetical protein